MFNDLYWKIEENTIFLLGSLNHKTLNYLWEKKEKIMEIVEVIDVSNLQHIDSSGLALLIHLYWIAQQHGIKLMFSGITKKLYSLIKLYNLQKIIISFHQFD